MKLKNTQTGEELEVIGQINVLHTNEDGSEEVYTNYTIVEGGETKTVEMPPAGLETYEVVV